MSKEINIQHPLIRRYASPQMMEIFTDDFKYGGWRNFWVDYAESLMEVSNGKLASQNEVNDLKSKMDPKYIDWKAVREIEKRRGHDVVAHAEHYRNQCPIGGRLVHVALTSRDLTDNVELYRLKRALQRIHHRSIGSLKTLEKNVKKYRDKAVVAQTHLQKADVITVGKRFAMWGTPLIMSIERIEQELQNFKGRGIEGAVGDKKQLIRLFGGDEEAAKKVNDRVMNKMGFKSSFLAIGQQYPREYEYQIFNPLAIQCANMHKVGNDITILQHDGELEEPIKKEKISSSSMGGKRNPNLSERMIGLSNYVKGAIDLSWKVASETTLEGDVRDSSPRRMYHMEIMLGMDALHTLYQTIMHGITVYDKVCERNVMNSLAVTSLQSIETEAVKRGGDRIQLHIKAGDLAMKDFKLVKEGEESKLIEDIKKDDLFKQYLKPGEIDSFLDPSENIKRSQIVCDRFLQASNQVFERNKDILPIIIKSEI